MRRLIAAVLLLFRFLGAVVVAGFTTVATIAGTGLGLRQMPASGFIRFRFAPMSEQGAALLGAMVSLTPGTTVIDIDMEAREMAVHMLDLSQADGMVRSLRLTFEPGLVTLFGEARR